MRSGRWRVSRQDDHGNAFSMAAFASRDEADAECVRFSALPHRQHYWVAPCQDPAVRPDSKA